jgi:hypothetical protein
MEAIYVDPASVPVLVDRGPVERCLTAAPRPPAKPTEEAPGGVYSQTGPHAFIPIWILDPAAYLPGCPNPGKLTEGDKRPLNNSEIRTYIALRSFADRYSGHAFPLVKTIAARAGIHPHGAEKAIGKFKRLGWLTTERRHKYVNGHKLIERCDYYVIDVCPQPRLAEGSPTVADAEEGVPADSRVGYPPDRGSNKHTTETPQGSVPYSPDSGRFAPFVGANENDQEQDCSGPAAASAREVTEKVSARRTEDRANFRAVVGDVLRVVNTKGWKPGNYTADAIYNGLRKQVRKRPIRWPGGLLNDIYAARAEEGVDDWLIDEGMERVAP